MLSAISLGVFCRSAPSTSAIMRSRNVWPGSEVMRTTIRSESTRVPPVTALRSPPLSRITGADSPVMADSSTEAMPSMTSPSPGMISPATTSTTSPLRSSLAATCFDDAVRPRRWRASRSWCVRSVSAWALPRPSAIASAKLANSTVNQSQPLTRPTNRESAVARREGGDEGDGRDHAADLDDEHHWVAGDLARVELDQRAADRRPRSRPRIDACAPGRAGRLDVVSLVIGVIPAHEKRWPAFIRNCSTIGPSANAGK